MQYLLLCLSLYCTSATITVNEQPVSPTFGVTSFTVTNAGTPTPGIPPRVIPNTQIQSDGVQTTCGAVVVGNYDTGMNIDVKIGSYDLAKNLPSAHLSTMICTNSPGFPPLPAVVTVLQSGSTTVLFTKQVAAVELPNLQITELRFWFRDPRDKAPSAPSSPSSPSSPSITVPTSLIYMKMLPRQLVPANTTLTGSSSGWRQHHSFELSCTPFTIGHPITCTVVADNQYPPPYPLPYPLPGTPLTLGISVRSFGLNGDITGYLPLTVGNPHSTIFLYDGFIQSIPQQLGSNQLVTLSGDFNAYIPITSYSCVFVCPTTTTTARPSPSPDVHWRESATMVERGQMECATPDFSTTSSGTPSGVPPSAQCQLTINIDDSKPVPTLVTANNTFRYDTVMLADPVLLHVHTPSSNNSVGPGMVVALKIGTTCPGLMIANNYDHSILRITFNDTVWIEDLPVGYNSPIRCLGEHPTNYTVHINVHDTVDDKTLWDGTVGTGDTHEEGHAESTTGYWSVLQINKWHPTKLHHYTINNMKCALKRPDGYQWDLHCPTPSHSSGTHSTTYLPGDTIPCKVAEVNIDTFPVLRVITGYEPLHVQCNITWPTAEYTLYPTPPMYHKAITTSTSDNQLWLVGFILPPHRTEPVRVGEEWTGHGLFGTSSDLVYQCEYKINASTTYSDASQWEGNQLSCRTPPSTWFQDKGGLPATVNVTVFELRRSNGAYRVIPAYSSPIQINVTAPDHWVSPTAPTGGAQNIIPTLALLACCMVVGVLVA